MNEPLLTMTQDEIADICSRRNASTNRKIEAKQAEIDALAAQQQAEVEAVESLSTEQTTLEAQLAEPMPDAKAEIEARIEATRQQAEHYRRLHESNAREVALARALAASGATSKQIAAAMLADVPTDRLSAAVESLKETAPNLFAPTLARGVGGTTDPPRGGDPLAVGVRGVAMLSDSEYMAARASGAFDKMFGRK
jgi:septal ring factor EnvC (AmiA/AmiB activator)